MNMMTSVFSGDRYYGDMCECAGNLSSSDPLAGCRVPPHIGWGVTSVCSGRGECVCGACECDTGDMEIYGEWCQCDNIQCDRDKSGRTSTNIKLYRALFIIIPGSLCGGHGSCVCRECECEPGWSGPACDCREAPHLCLAPDTEVTIIIIIIIIMTDMSTCVFTDELQWSRHV